MDVQGDEPRGMKLMQGCVFAFRVDASLSMGIGHVMRCLTLADALSAEGAECHFIGREHPGHLMDRVRSRGHRVHLLPPAASMQPTFFSSTPAHASWLGVDWQLDAEQSGAYLRSNQPNWLIVDHYALDQRWEASLRTVCPRIAVIDDLADRAHDCELLLDQTLGRNPRDYAGLAPERCSLLTGARYALLRPQFPALRDYSLSRRRQRPTVKHLLVSLGGIDRANATARVLEGLEHCSLPSECAITIVMGAAAPWLSDVRRRAANMIRPVQVLVDVPDMAALMSESDLAIGAAGSTSWERCCLGVPALMLVLADNQRDVAYALEATGAAVVLKEAAQMPAAISTAVNDILASNQLETMSRAAANVTDGRGVDAVVRWFKDASW